jgi:hypothetical protein
MPTSPIRLRASDPLLLESHDACQTASRLLHDEYVQYVRLFVFFCPHFTFQLGANITNSSVRYLTNNIKWTRRTKSDALTRVADSSLTSSSGLFPLEPLTISYDVVRVNLTRQHTERARTLDELFPHGDDCVLYFELLGISQHFSTFTATVYIVQREQVSGVYVISFGLIVSSAQYYKLQSCWSRFQFATFSVIS